MGRSRIADYPEMPMTMAGDGDPSFMMHQFLLSALRRASSSRSCCRIGRPLSLNKLQVARLHPEAYKSRPVFYKDITEVAEQISMPIYTFRPALGLS